MDRTEYELRKLVLIVGTQRAFSIMKDVERAVCPPPTEESIARPSDNDGKVIHVPFGSKGKRGRQAASDGPSAMLERFFGVSPNGGCAEFIRFAQQINGSLSKNSLTTTYYKKYRQYRAA